MEIINMAGKFIKGLSQSSNEYIQAAVALAIISSFAFSSYGTKGK